jgi:hypothetical protein
MAVASWEGSGRQSHARCLEIGGKAASLEGFQRLPQDPPVVIAFLTAWLRLFASLPMCISAAGGYLPRLRLSTTVGMTHPALSGTAALHPEDLLRIRQSCSHTYVPEQPAERGYRYIDVGGGGAPQKHLRLTARRVSGAISLIAPIELTSTEPAERGAAAIARASVSIGVNTLAWHKLLDQDVCSGVWATLMTDALQELARLDLLEPALCPFCSQDGDEPD